MVLLRVVHRDRDPLLLCDVERAVAARGEQNRGAEAEAEQGHSVANCL